MDHVALPGLGRCRVSCGLHGVSLPELRALAGAHRICQWVCFLTRQPGAASN